MLACRNLKTLRLQRKKDIRYTNTVGHTGIHAWGNRVRRQFFGGGAVVVEPRIPCLSGMGSVKMTLNMTCMMSTHFMNS